MPNVISGKQCSLQPYQLIGLNMPVEYISLLSGFVGAIVGALASITTVWVQQHSQEKRDRARLALEAAIKEFESADNNARFLAEHHKGQRIQTFDLGYYIVLHARLWECIGSGKPPSRENWRTAHKEALELSDAAMAEYEARYQHATTQTQK